MTISNSKFSLWKKCRRKTKIWETYGWQTKKIGDHDVLWKSFLQTGQEPFILKWKARNFLFISGRHMTQWCWMPSAIFNSLYSSLNCCEQNGIQFWSGRPVPSSSSDGNKSCSPSSPYSSDDFDMAPPKCAAPFRCEFSDQFKNSWIFHVSSNWNVNLMASSGYSGSHRYVICGYIPDMMVHVMMCVTREGTCL